MTISNTTASDNIFACRRAEDVDRRQAHFKAVLRSFFNGRRRSLRRDKTETIEELRQLEKPYSYGMLFGILIFLVFDAILSLSLVTLVGDSTGSVIQIMSQSSSLQSYFLFKSVVASICVFFVAIYQSVPALSNISATKILVTIMSCYIALMAVEIVLIV